MSKMMELKAYKRTAKTGKRLFQCHRSVIADTLCVVPRGLLLALPIAMVARGVLHCLGSSPGAPLLGLPRLCRSWHWAALAGEVLWVLPRLQLNRRPESWRLWRLQGDSLV